MSVSFREPHGIDRIAPPNKTVDTSFGQRLAATVRTENQLQMAWDKSQWFTDNGPPVEGYDGLDHVPPDLVDDWEAFVDDHSPKQTELTAGWLRERRKQRGISASGGMLEQIGTGMFVGFSDVTTLPFMAVPALRATTPIRAAIAAATGASVEAAASESVLHSLDPTRTREETLYTLGASALFGSALGGLAGAMSKRSFAKAQAMQEEIDKLVKLSEEDGGVEKALGIVGDAGAARIDSSLEDLDLGVGASWVALPWINPVTRMLKAKSAKVRNVANKLLEHDLYLSGNRKGKRKAIATETRIKRTKMVGKFRVRNIIKKLHGDYKKSGGTLKINEFADEVGRAMVRGDDHSVEQIAKASALIRSEVVEPIKAGFTKLGVFTEDLETRFADSYFPRDYDWAAIKADRPKFRKMLEDDFIEQGLDAEEAMELSDIIMDKIRSTPVGLMPKDLVGSTGRLKQRGINIRDEKLQEMGFLRTNVVQVMDRYLDSVVPEMHLRIDTGGIEKAESLKALEENYKARVKEIKELADEELKNPTQLRDASKKETKAWYKDLVENEGLRYREEKQSLKNRYEGELEDARTSYDKAKRKPDAVLNKAVSLARKTYKTANNKNTAELESAQSSIRTRWSRIIKNTNDKWDADKRKLKPSDRAAFQKKKEAEVRKARAERDKELDSAKRSAGKRKAELQKSRDTKVEAANRAHKKSTATATKAFNNKKETLQKTRERGVQAARNTRGKNTRTLKATRDKLLGQDQKTKVASEKNIRAHRTMTLKKMKQETKAQRKNLTADGGTHALTEELNLIEKEYDALIERATTSRERKKLESEQSRMRQDVEAMRDRLLGTHGRPVNDMRAYTNINRNVRGVAFTAYMGMMAIAQLPEIARPIMKHGVSAWARGVPAGVGRFFTPLDSNKLAHEFMDMGAAGEGLLSSRALMSYEAEELTGKMASWTNFFARVTLMNRITDSIKMVAGVAAQHRALRDIMNWENLSPTKRTAMLKFGIDDDMAARIASEQPAGGWDTMGSAYHANTAKWVDREAAEHFELAILRDIDSAITTPGAGDKPLFMSYEMGKLLGQFKTFFYASHSRVYVPMLQQMAHGDANAAVGAIAMMSIAYMVWHIRMFSQGRWDEIENYGPLERVMETLDRSGLAMLPMEGFNTTDRAFEGSVRSMMGMEPGSRYYNRSVLGALIGPGPGMIEGAVRSAATGANVLAGQDELTDGDVRRARKLLPGQNLFYTRWIYDQMEEAVVESTGAKRTSR